MRLIIPACFAVLAILLALVLTDDHDSREKAVPSKPSTVRQGTEGESLGPDLGDTSSTQDREKVGASIDNAAQSTVIDTKIASIKGRVLDFDTNLPIAYAAEIYLRKGDNAYTATDALGYFTIPKNISSGDAIWVKSTGYFDETVNLPVTAINGGQLEPIIIQMRGSSKRGVRISSASGQPAAQLEVGWCTLRDNSVAFADDIIATSLTDDSGLAYIASPGSFIALSMDSERLFIPTILRDSAAMKSAQVLDSHVTLNFMDHNTRGAIDNPIRFSATETAGESAFSVNFSSLGAAPTPIPYPGAVNVKITSPWATLTESQSREIERVSARSFNINEQSGGDYDVAVRGRVGYVECYLPKSSQYVNDEVGAIFLRADKSRQRLGTLRSARGYNEISISGVEGEPGTSTVLIQYKGRPNERVTLEALRDSSPEYPAIVAFSAQSGKWIHLNEINGHRIIDKIAITSSDPKSQSLIQRPQENGLIGPVLVGTGDITISRYSPTGGLFDGPKSDLIKKVSASAAAGKDVVDVDVDMGYSAISIVDYPRSAPPIFISRLDASPLVPGKASDQGICFLNVAAGYYAIGPKRHLRQLQYRRSFMLESEMCAIDYGESVEISWNNNWAAKTPAFGFINAQSTCRTPFLIPTYSSEVASIGGFEFWERMELPVDGEYRFPVGSETPDALLVCLPRDGVDRMGGAIKRPLICGVITPGESFDISVHSLRLIWSENSLPENVTVDIDPTPGKFIQLSESILPDVSRFSGLSFDWNPEDPLEVEQVPDSLRSITFTAGSLSWTTPINSSGPQLDLDVYLPK